MESQLTLTTEMVIVLTLLGVTIGLMVLETFRIDVVALLVLVVLGVSGIVPGEHVFDGFASNAVMAIIAVMIMGAALERTGAMNAVAALIIRRGKQLEARTVALTCVLTGLFSSVIQNVGAVALFVPVVSRVAARTGIAASRLMMPMGFAAILGGTITTVGSSPMIILNELLANANKTLPQGADVLKPFGTLAVLPIGVMLLAAGTLYMTTLGRKLLPQLGGKSAQRRDTQRYLAATYGIDGDVFELLVTADSPLVGQTVGEAEVATMAPPILALKSADEARLAPPGDELIWVGSVMGVLGTRTHVEAYAKAMDLRVLPGLRSFGALLDPARAGIAEVVISPASRFIGKSARQIRLRKTYGISVLALSRGGEVHHDDARDLQMQGGDCLVVHSAWRDLVSLARERELMLATDIPEAESQPHKAWLAISCLLLSLLLAVTTDLKLAVCLMAGAVAVIVGGVLSMDDAYKSIGWRSVFSLGSLLALAYAMETTATAAYIAQEVVSLLTGVPQIGLQLAIAVLASFFSLVLSNVGATVLMVPLAINIALASDGDPRAYALIAALASCNCFLLPTDQVNSLVIGPGGYRVQHYLRVGSVLTVIYLVVLLAAVNFWWWIGPRWLV